ncbi:hypothetical protein BGZ76_002864 [Entomortierella beljakovae]|nr:hypothetical protein BGZ76_002864 [Entomortierella beljakovae]
MTNSTLCETSRDPISFRDLSAIASNVEPEDDYQSIWTQSFEQLLVPVSPTIGSAFQFEGEMEIPNYGYNLRNMSACSLDTINESTGGSTSTGISARSREKRRKVEPDFDWGTDLYNFEACYNLNDFTPSLASFLMMPQQENSNEFIQDILSTPALSESAVMENFDPIMGGPEFQFMDDGDAFELPLLDDQEVEASQPSFEHSQGQGLLEGFEFDDALECPAISSGIQPPDLPLRDLMAKSEAKPEKNRSKRRIEITKLSTFRSGRWSDAEDKALIQGVVGYLGTFGLESQPPSHLPLEQNLQKGRVLAVDSSNVQDANFLDLESISEQESPIYHKYYDRPSLSMNSRYTSSDTTPLHPLISISPAASKITLSSGTTSLTSDLFSFPNVNLGIPGDSPIRDNLNTNILRANDIPDTNKLGDASIDRPKYLGQGYCLVNHPGYSCHLGPTESTLVQSQLRQNYSLPSNRHDTSLIQEQSCSSLFPRPLNVTLSNTHGWFVEPQSCEVPGQGQVLTQTGFIKESPKAVMSRSS